MEDPTNRTKTYWKLTKATQGQNATQNIPALVVNGITVVQTTSAKPTCQMNFLHRNRSRHQSHLMKLEKSWMIPDQNLILYW